MSNLVVELKAFLSPETRVTLFFEGKNPDAECLKNLRGYIDMMEMSLLGSRTSNCEKHPWSSVYTKTGACRACVLIEAKSKKKLRAV